MVSIVLAHPSRITILDHLANEKASICGGFVLETGLSQPTISQHLIELKTIGSIKGTIKETLICYCIDTKKWKKTQHLLATFYKKSSLSDDACC